MFEENNYELWQGDCLELMSNISDKSVDMIFTDLPYNTTQNSWDCMINLDELWKQYKRIIKQNGCIALWAQAPFSHVLALSNLSQYRYEWIIEKTKATGHLNAKKMPMKAHENVMVFADLDESPETLQIFYGKLPAYNPQMTEGHTPVHMEKLRLVLAVVGVHKDIQEMFCSLSGILRNQVYTHVRSL